MSSWLDLASDKAFGPQFRDKFDFTLEFEHTILTVVPASFFIAAVPIFFFIFQRRPNIIMCGNLLWAKLVSSSRNYVVALVNSVNINISHLDYRRHNYWS